MSIGDIIGMTSAGTLFVLVVMFWIVFEKVFQFRIAALIIGIIFSAFVFCGVWHLGYRDGQIDALKGHYEYKETDSGEYKFIDDSVKLEDLQQEIKQLRTQLKKGESEDAIK